MKKKTLFDTNPYLQDHKKFKKDVIANVLSSIAIEMGRVPKSLQRALKAYDFKSTSLLDLSDWTPSLPK